MCASLDTCFLAIAWDIYFLSGILFKEINASKLRYFPPPCYMPTSVGVQTWRQKRKQYHLGKSRAPVPYNIKLKKSPHPSLSSPLGAAVFLHPLLFQPSIFSTPCHFSPWKVKEKGVSKEHYKPFNNKLGGKNWVF